VTPTGFLAGEYFTRLRALLQSNAPPFALDLIEHRKGVFEDVLQEALLSTHRIGAQASSVSVNVLTLVDDDSLKIERAGHFFLPDKAGMPWLVPRRVSQEPLLLRLRSMPCRLVDWGYSVSTGPLVWNRHKRQLRSRSAPGCFPLIWAEAVTPDGRFVFRAGRRNHKPYFRPADEEEWLVIRASCVLVQRTTAKEQTRRLVAATLPSDFVALHGGVVVENHLNMLRPTVEQPPVSAEVLTAFLNSDVVDQAFRCVSGSVAVSAYELEALPLPAPTTLEVLHNLIAGKASPADIERACAALYGIR
jgi:adenine-specific DNA-methyltransferase